MSKPRNPPADEAVDSEAINRVLRAEQAAQQAVDRCEQQAQAIVQNAHMQAQRVGQRADERITWVEMRCAQWLREQARQLAMAEAGQADAAEFPEREVSPVVEALAARLTGTEEGSP